MPRDLALVSAAVALGALCVQPAAAVADEPRRIEAGAFLGLDAFGDDIELGNSWAAEQKPGTAFLLGLRGGVILLPDLAGGSDLDPGLGVELEGKLAFASTGEVPENGRMSYAAPVLGWRAQLVGRLGLGGKLTPHLVVGVGGESVLTASPFMTDDTDAAFHWGPGASWRLGGGLDARLDLRHGVTAGRDGAASTFEMQLGVVKAWDWSCPRVPPRPAIADQPDEPDADPDPAPAIVDPTPPPPPDPDGDGRAGAQDACAEQPEDTDGFEDEDGCPDPDNDRDARADTDDKCPDLPETYNGFHDEDGCPDELPAALAALDGVVEGVTFDTGKARIRPSSRATLDEAAATLREHTSIRIRIEGHTDNVGTRAKNLDLSRRRADAVKWYLVDKGIPADRIETVGHGPDLPLDPAKTARARAKNRRIEIHILFADPTPPAPATQPATPPSAQPSGDGA